MSIFKRGLFFGIAICDVSTGEFYATKITQNNNFERLLDEISRFSPAEIITNDLMYSSIEEINKIKERFGIFISKGEEEAFKEEANDIISNYEIIDETQNKIEKLEEELFILSAINGLLEYLNKTQKIKLKHLNKIQIYTTNKYMALDINARRNLEITEKMRDKTKKGTLLWVLDKTSTSMGGRHLRRWLNDPLIDIQEINKRLFAVKELKDSIILRGDIIEALKKVYDIERLIGKISYGNANGRDMISLKNSVKELPKIKQILSKVASPLLKQLYEELDELKDIYEIIDRAIIEEPPISVKEGGLIKIGYNEEIDKLKLAGSKRKKLVSRVRS